MSPRGCPNCGAPRIDHPDAGSSTLHVPGCGPGASWEASVHIGRVVGPWEPIERSLAWLIHTQRADARVRRAP